MNFGFLQRVKQSIESKYAKIGTVVGIVSDMVLRGYVSSKIMEDYLLANPAIFDTVSTPATLISYRGAAVFGVALLKNYQTTGEIGIVGLDTIIFPICGAALGAGAYYVANRGDQMPIDYNQE